MKIYISWKTYTYLSQVDWNIIFQQDNIKLIWKSFETVLTDGIAKCSPKRLRRAQDTNKGPWMSKEAMKVIRSKKKAWDRH